MSLYRDDFKASVARAASLEREVEQLRQQRLFDQATIAILSQQLHAKQRQNSELATLIGRSKEPEERRTRVSNSVMVVVLSIIALLFAHPLGPIAWFAANLELRRINAGFSDPSNRPMIVAGKVLSIAATAIFVITALVFLFSNSTSQCPVNYSSCPW